MSEQEMKRASDKVRDIIDFFFYHGEALPKELEVEFSEDEAEDKKSITMGLIKRGKNFYYEAIAEVTSGPASGRKFSVLVRPA